MEFQITISKRNRNIGGYEWAVDITSLRITGSSLTKASAKKAAEKAAKEWAERRRATAQEKPESYTVNY
jgi:hypothetical protein